MHNQPDPLPPVHDLAVLAEADRVSIVACGANETRPLIVLPSRFTMPPAVVRLLRRVIGARRPRRVLLSRMGTERERAGLLDVVEGVEDLAEGAGVEVVHLPDLARVVASRTSISARDGGDEQDDEPYDDA